MAAHLPVGLAVAAGGIAVRWRLDGIEQWCDRVREVLHDDEVRVRGLRPGGVAEPCLG